jgi:hypothetical protein
MGAESIWSADMKVPPTRGYFITRVDTSGRVRLKLERRVEWWTSAARPGTFTPLQDTVFTPYPSVRDVGADRAGHVLVLIPRARADWKAVKPTDRFAEGNYTSVVEVLDPAAARLLGTVRVTGFPIRFIGDSRFATYREDAEGVPWVDVWELSIRR